MERWRRREGRRKNKIWSRDGTITGEECKKKRRKKKQEKRDKRNKEGE